MSNTSAGLQSLAEPKKEPVAIAIYIAEHYEGNQSAFARDLGLTRSQIYQYLNAAKPVYVFDGKLWSMLRKID